MSRHVSKSSWGALLFLGTLAAQQPAPPSLLQARGLARATVQSLIVPTVQNVVAGLPSTMQVSIAGSSRVVYLRPYDMRAPGYQLLVQDAAGIRPIQAPPPLTMRGTVEGDERAGVAASLTEAGEFSALILLGDEEWAIEPIAGSTDYLVYQAGDLPVPDFHCVDVGSQVPTGDSVISRHVPLVAEIAIEADAEFVSLHGGSTSATQNDILQVMNAVDLIFQRDTAIMYQITNVIFGPTYGTTNPTSMLTAMSIRWNAGYTTVPRDLGHLFTGAVLSGNTVSRSNIGVVCTPNQYALTRSLYTSTLPHRVAATAHGLGSNWNASSCSGSGCNIMCSTIGGCSLNVSSFGATAVTQIMTYSDTVRGCLGMPGAGFSSDGADVTFVNLDNDPRQEIVFMSVDDPSGANSFFVGIGWNVDATGFTTQWSSPSLAQSGFGNDSEGGGIAFEQLDSNPAPDMLLMAVDAPSGPNAFVYRVLFNVNTNLVPNRSSSLKTVSGIGNDGDGGAAAFALIDANSTPDLILMTYDDPAQANYVQYKIAYNIDANGNWSSLSGPVTSGGFGNEGEGAGIRAGYFNKNHDIDLVVMAYDTGGGASNPNDIRYKFLYDIQSNGWPTTESAVQVLPGHGNRGQGAGVAVADLNGNGRAEVLFGVLDYASSGVNQFRWTMLTNLGVVQPRFGQFGASCRAGMVHSLSGTGWRGTVLNLNLAGAPPISPLLCAIGLSRTFWSPYQLPLNLTLIGAPSCFAYTDGLAFLSSTTLPFGTTSIQYTISSSPAAIGIEIFTQCYVRDLGLNSAGIASSNACSLVIGG